MEEAPGHIDTRYKSLVQAECIWLEFYRFLRCRSKNRHMLKERGERMFRRFLNTSAITLAAAAMIVSAFFAMSVTSATAQIQCYDNETWEVDRSAIEKVFSNIESYAGTNRPILINLKSLGADVGQLVVVFIEKDLMCAKQQYESSSPAPSGPLVTICKRPKCS